ncbi:hypothetical protein ABCR94_02685 [Streptomyces sp. 21So2-11]|uniref:hypothetical protein n=1 Tax=Streptomyces sp. 21So2-11 TaxID=3144408 RepID=UPI00321A2861
MTVGIVFASSASADSDPVPTETTAVAFAEAGTGPEKVVNAGVQPLAWASIAKKAAGSFAGSAAYDYIKASNAIPQRKGRAFKRGDVGVDLQSDVNLSRSFD